MQRPRGCGIGELADGRHDPAPSRRSVIIAGESELISSGGAFLKGVIGVALEHELRCSPNVDLRYHFAKGARFLSIKT